MAYAVSSDVEISLGRSLTEAETMRVNGLLDRVETRIRRRISDLADQITADATFRDVVVEVEADVVARFLRNPDGLLQEQDGDYLYIRDRALPPAGVLDLTEQEWARLGVTSAAFTITPATYELVDGYWAAPDTWVPL